MRQSLKPVISVVYITSSWRSLLQPPKRGLSLEEKRTKLLEVFHETKDVFVLKVRSMQICCTPDQSRFRPRRAQQGKRPVPLIVVPRNAHLTFITIQNEGLGRAIIGIY